MTLQRLIIEIMTAYHHLRPALAKADAEGQTFYKTGYSQKAFHFL
jgi:hypothetical protein